MDKLFLSADIEGVCGIVDWSETDVNDRHGDYFKKQMTKEVAAACEAANKSGVKDIFIKDAHGSGRSIDPSLLPKNIKLMRAWTRGPASMMAGIDETYNGVGFIGYHSAAGCDGNPLAHTMNGNIFEVKINNIQASEFVLNAYTAASYGIPVYFLSGDKALCESAKEIQPNIKTNAVSEGLGAASISIHPELALENIRAMVTSALAMNPKKMMVNFPDRFSVSVTYKKHEHAYRASFYPGVKRVGVNQVKISCKNWSDILAFIFFTF